LPELPPPPVAAAQSGGSKFAEAANKTMKTVKNLKKNWKKGIGDKLRRLSTPNPIAVMEAQAAAMALGNTANKVPYKLKKYIF